MFCFPSSVHGKFHGVHVFSQIACATSELDWAGIVHFPSAASPNVTDFCFGLDRHLLRATYNFTPEHVPSVSSRQPNFQSK
jgi:hypothetical protein